MFGWLELIEGVWLWNDLLVNVIKYVKCVEELIECFVVLLFILFECDDIIFVIDFFVD